MTFDEWWRKNYGHLNNPHTQPLAREAWDAATATAAAAEREPSPEALAAAERCRSLADPGWVDWPNMPAGVYADMRLVLAEFLRLAPPPAPG